ncbi:DDE-type integrase/transposase/recombinase [Streptomyces somaliensis]|uniref:DDE-type integrase/transposase/recombinase n=1 Tax=Streptomyces somaliensis TaxID=78355 RepID=UPI0020CB9338|nr:DDE-type integrase/transposase/recombinase [Streptomyces somaliensis]MCP9945589.1 DDE-type integrase/transposase/recombinase [Streptomyces somaliensis]MCP9961227.1 DDE-type integrase/transposase/recombinase [Streptomyces somaliensis]
MRTSSPAHRPLVTPPCRTGELPAVWLDLAAREIVGYSMADHHRASLVVDALAMAAGHGRLRPGCIAHSDRGSEYTSEELRRELSRSGLRQSMGRTGSCFDNAAVESFLAVLKEEIGTHRWPDRATARAKSSPSSRSSTTAGGCGSIRTGAARPRWRSGSDTSKDTPPRRKHGVSGITGKVQ